MNWGVWKSFGLSMSFMSFCLDAKERKNQVWKSSAKNEYSFLKTLKLTRQNAELKQQTFLTKSLFIFLTLAVS